MIFYFILSTTSITYSWIFVVSLPAYWLTRVIVWLLLATLFPLSCVLFGRRIHDIGFNAWAGILWSVIMIFINTLLSCLSIQLHARAFLYGSSASYSGYCQDNLSLINMATLHLCL